MMVGENNERIIIYLLSLSGGAGKSALKYSGVFAAAGKEVLLICGATTDTSLNDKMPPNVKLMVLDASRNHQVPRKLAPILRDYQPDKLLVTGLSNMLPVSVALALLGRKPTLFLRVGISPSGMLASYSPMKRLVKRVAFASSFRMADHVIVLTRAMQEELAIDWHVHRDKMTLIYNGISLPEAPPVVRRSEDPPVILCVGRLVPQKDHETLLRAFALLRANRLCRLRLAGSGSEKGRLVALATELGISADVEFLGHVMDVAPLYRTATLTVLSSRFEGFPNVLIEALAQGCPIVATDCPTGPREIVNNDSVGQLAKVGNVEDLARKLQKAFQQDYDPVRLLSRAEAFSDARFAEEVTQNFANATTGRLQHE